MTTFARDDLSTKLIHLTHGPWEEAYGVLGRILAERRLAGTASMINDGLHCVCFNEAPISKISLFLAQPPSGFRYAPFGVMVDKTWLFLRGGRPVIYQPESEYHLLHPDQRYRHKRYEPDRGIDFTWEREWRVRTDSFALDPGATTVIVPTRRWEERLLAERGGRLWGDEAGDAARRVMVLEDLGIPFEEERQKSPIAGEAL